MVKPSPDVYPDLWNDLWLKEYAIALVKCQWGRNLTKFQQVNLPGGITMNGDQILSMGREDLKALKDRFSMDWVDPALGYGRIMPGTNTFFSSTTGYTGEQQLDR